MLRHILVAVRPDQWTKNAVLFAGLIFAGAMTSPLLALLAFRGFVVFCMLSASTYLMNDLVDIRSDREHPEKRTRPIASGALSPRVAAAVGIVTALVALIWAYGINNSFGYVATGYLVLSACYSLVLRRIVILDVMAIAAGFVLRAVASVEVLIGAAPRTELSPWLLVCTFFLALFLALSKRRHEVVALGSTATDHRTTLGHYPPALIDSLISVVTASAVVSYAIYTIWPGTVEKVGGTGLVYTVPFVAYGVFRYLYLMSAEGAGGKPSRALVTDLPLAVNVILWVVAVGIVIYIE